MRILPGCFESNPVLKTALCRRARDELLPHRDFSFFLQRRAASYNFAVNLVFLLIPFRLSQGQFYASHETSLAERDRRYAEQNTAEWTCFKVWEICCCD